ncbi:MAG: hypothetical protein NTU79_00405 [Planctomycetota bacterium]|nr:hypothetical protein [Planctomycetota bacterium]
MSKHEPIYLSEFAELVGLDEKRWEVAIDKQKSSGDRKVIVWVRDKMTGLQLVDAIGGRFTKEQLDRHAKRIAQELAKRILGD